MKKRKQLTIRKLKSRYKDGNNEKRYYFNVKKTKMKI